jgi:hypothetical protein
MEEPGLPPTVRVGRAIAARESTTSLLERLFERSDCASSSITYLLLSFAMQNADKPLHEETLEWFRRRGCEAQIVCTAILQSQSWRVYDWLLTKKPDIFSWDYCGIWEAAYNASVVGTEHSPNYSWLVDRVGPEGVPSLATRESARCSAMCYSIRSISFLLSLGSHPPLEEAILRRVIAGRNWRLLRPFAKKPGAIRAVLLADGGRVLRATKKTPKCLLRFLSPSDRASIGLPRSAH